MNDRIIRFVRNAEVIIYVISAAVRKKVEDELNRLFPNATTVRMDMDTTGKKQSHEKILQKFEKDKIDILIGTQMVAKGLDFEKCNACRSYNGRYNAQY